MWQNPVGRGVGAGIYPLVALGRAARAPLGLAWLGAGAVRLLCCSLWSVALTGLCCWVVSLVPAASLGRPALALLRCLSPQYGFCVPVPSL